MQLYNEESQINPKKWVQNPCTHFREIVALYQFLKSNEQSDVRLLPAAALLHRQYHPQQGGDGSQIHRDLDIYRRLFI